MEVCRQLHAEAILPPGKGTWYPLNRRHCGRHLKLNSVEKKEKISPTWNGIRTARFPNLQPSHRIASTDFDEMFITATSWCIYLGIDSLVRLFPVFCHSFAYLCQANIDRVPGMYASSTSLCILYLSLAVILKSDHYKICSLW